MQLEFLGTGAGTPARYRNVTGIALRLLEEINAVWLFDVGEGTQHQILRSTIRPGKVNKIFITHLHGDHIFGLPGFLSSRSFQGGEDALDIYGPHGIKQFVETSLHVSQSHLTYKLRFHELADEGGLVLQDDDFTVMALPLDHKIQSFGYRVIERDHPGELQVAKLQDLNIPAGPVYGQLKAGKDVVLDENIVRLAEGATVLVHESTYGKGEGKLARSYYHSTSLQAGQAAHDAGVGRLFLTHISARYAGKQANELAYQAQGIFENTRVVNDFDVFEIPMGVQSNSKPIKLKPDHDQTIVK